MGLRHRLLRRTGLAGAVLILALLGAACAARPAPALPGSAGRALPGTVRVGEISGASATIVVMALEEYVLASILSEVAPAGQAQAVLARLYEVQAIVARTYAVAHRGRHDAQGYDLCATTHCQLVEPERLQSSRWRELAARAVRQTEGLVLVYAGAPAETLFHADCGGRTSNADAIWGGRPQPYLLGRADRVPHGSHSTWRFDIDGTRLGAALDRDPITAPGARVDQVAVVARDAAGRAVRLEVRGQRAVEMRGEHFRTAVTRAFGPRSLRSTWFEVRREAGRFVFEGRGYGHGVGLCQTGALARARAGASFRTILAFYYPGTALAKGRNGRSTSPIPSPFPRIRR